MTNYEPTNEDIEKTLAQATGFHMSAQGKSRVRLAISTYADQHPAGVLSPFGDAFSFTAILFSRRSAYALASIFLLVTVGAGTTYASESSLPGDTLYPVKVSISEPLQGVLIPTVRGKASWHAKLAERRLDEAATLAAAHMLDAKTGTYLAAAFNTNVDASLHDADSLERAGDFDDATRVKDGLEATVTAHAAILRLVADSGASFTPSSNAIASSSLEKNTQNGAIQDIADKVALTSNVLVVERMKSDGIAEVLPMHSAPRKEGANTPSSKQVVASTTIEPSSNILIKTTQPITASNAVSTSSSTVFTNELKKPVLQVTAREKARAEVMSNIFEKNQNLLRKLGISATTTEERTSNKVEIEPIRPLPEPQDSPITPSAHI